MGFADFYFNKYKAEPALIKENPANDLQIIITVPCFNEEHTIKALSGLYRCLPTHKAVEVIILVNYPENRQAEFSQKHKKIFEELNKWAIGHNSDKLKFFPVLKELPQKTAGVGLARKLAMDEALRRFDFLNNPNGIIVGYDADCSCDTNYLQAIEQLFEKYPKTTGCSINYEHSIEGDEFSEEIYQAIVQYELYLRYYIEALRSSGFPYTFHTLGSSFAVRADVYAMQGGMNKRKAGEDFYFLHKIIPLGNFHEINNTKVIPSPRLSDRVPFGTGAAITKIIESGQPVYFTFNPDAFDEIGKFIKLVPEFFKVSTSQIEEIIANLHPSLLKFIHGNQFQKAIEDANSNSSNLETFKKRFYTWFNGLMVLQFLNEAHLSDFTKVSIAQAAEQLLKSRYNLVGNYSTIQLLEKYRDIQKNSTF